MAMAMAIGVCVTPSAIVLVVDTPVWNFRLAFQKRGVEPPPR